MKINLLIFIVFLSIIIYANINESHGIVGLTKRDGGIGCLCHDLTPTDSVIVWIDGPDSVLRNSSAQYKLFMTGGAAIAGGFNLSSFFGELDSVDTLTQVLFGELTHTSPNPFQDDTVTWNFFYTAPDSLLIDTLYSVANSVNLDSIPSDLDQWNFGENFIVNVIDQPVYVEQQDLLAKGFVLHQNYPNPFNPSTKIGFRIVSTGYVSLKVYDVLGNEVATLVNEEKSAGDYEVEFSPESSIQHPSSGIYFYKLEAGDFVQTKKLIFMK